MLWAPKFRKLAKYMHMVSISLPTGYVIYYAKALIRSIEEFCSQNQKVQIHHKMERDFFLLLYEKISSLGILRTPGMDYLAHLV